MILFGLGLEDGIALGAVGMSGVDEEAAPEVLDLAAALGGRGGQDGASGQSRKPPARDDLGSGAILAFSFGSGGGGLDLSGSIDRLQY